MYVTIIAHVISGDAQTHRHTNQSRCREHKAILGPADHTLRAWQACLLVC